MIRWRLLASVFLLTATAGTAPAQTWTASAVGGLWSDPNNWTPNTVPGPGSTATLDDATADRVISYDAAAPTGFDTLIINQVSAFTNTLDFNRAATLANGITLGATGGGTAEVRLTPPTTGNMTVTIPSVTLNDGGRFTMAASNPTAPRNTTLAGTVINNGGTLFVTALDPVTARAVTRTVTGGLTMTSGTITLDTTGTLTDTRLQFNGAVNVTGGSFTRLGTRTPQFNMSAATVMFNPTSFDTAIALGLLGGNQTAEIGTGGGATAFGQLLIRSFGVGPFTKTVTAGPGVTFGGAITIGNNVDGSTTILRLGSDINQTLTTGNPIGLADSPNPGTFTPTIDTNGFSLTTTSTSAWNPPNGSATRLANWSVINSGPAGQGRLRVASATFTTANQVSVGAGAVIEVFGNGATSNVGGNGTIDATSTLRFANTTTGATTHTINSNRDVGNVEIRGGAANHALTLQNEPAWAVQGELRAVQGIINVSNTNKFGSEIVFVGETAPVGTNFNSVLAQVTFNTALTNTTYTSAVPIDFAAIPAGHLGRARFQLAGTVGDTSRLELTGPVSLLAAVNGGSNYRVDFSSQRADQFLDVSGPITGGGGVNVLFVNGGNSGLGTVRLSNSGNTFPSTISVVNGTLLIGHSNALGTGTNNVNLADGATPASGATVRVLTDADGVTVSRNVNLGSTASAGTAAAYVVGGNVAGSSTFAGNVITAANPLSRNLQITAADGGTVTFGGIINPNNDAVGTLDVTKVGPGRVVFAGNNIYDGPTTVAAGTLLVNGNQSTATGLVTVDAGATLGGTGTIGGTTVVNGSVTPGVDGVGTLTLASAATINGTYIADVTTGPNTSDLLAVTGSLTLGAASELNLPLTNTYEPPMVGGPAYTIATYTDTLTGTFAVVTNLPAGYFVDYGITTSNAITLQPVPEPATVLAWCGVTATAFALRRRKRAA